ncbi:MAG TPA: hypothetical protein VF192_13645 [Longimicrobiales bacterium]
MSHSLATLVRTPTGQTGPAQHFHAHGTLALYCGDREVLNRLRGALAPGPAIVAADDWKTFQRASGGAVCSIVVLPWLDEAGAAAQLASLKERSPLQPLVLVTQKDAENLRLLKELSVEEIVWLHEAERELWGAIGRARASSLLRQMASAVEKAEHLPPKLRFALSHAFRSERPVRSVIELAAAVGCDRRTLWRHWRDGLGPDHPLLPGHFLDWLLLLRASGLKAPGQKWSAVAHQLGVHEHTVARLAKRLAGLSLRDVAAGGQPLIARLFAAHVLRPLLTPAP